MVIGAFVGLVLVMSLGPILPVHALYLESPRDCDSNAVIPCGALTPQELQTGFNSTLGVGALYAHFGISVSDVNNFVNTAQAGRVYKNGNVTIGDKLVATNAITAGRLNFSGSTKITPEGFTFYQRPPSVSFAVDSIAAFVVMENDEFKFAILAACSNPVMATALKFPKPAPPPPEQPKVVKIAIHTSTQVPRSRPVAVASATKVKELPITGPGDIGLVICLAIIGGYIYHVTHRHIRHRRHLRHTA